MRGTASDRIVVGVDGSKPSDDALRWGRFLAESIGATLQAVSARPSIAEWASPWVAADWPGVPQDLDPSKNATRVRQGRGPVESAPALPSVLPFAPQASERVCLVRRALIRSCVTRAAPATATTTPPPTAAMSRAIPSGRLPAKPM